MIEINKIHLMDCIEGLKQIPDESIDCIITDPPYGINYHSHMYKDGNPHSKIINDDKLFIPLEELWRVLKPTGAIFIFYSFKVPLIDERIKNVIIWVKNNATVGDLYGDFGNQYESIAFMPKKQFRLKTKRYTNIWHFDRIPPTRLIHPTQKPEPLIRKIVECATKEKDLILDSFMGSGTVAVVCKQMKRNFIGFEIEKKYVEIANERLNQNILF